MEENIEKDIKKKEEKENDENDEDEWESIPENEKTEETKDILYRLNIEKASKVKIDFHKLKNYHSIKVKRLEQKEKESYYNLDKYIKEKYMPNITINNDSNGNPYLTILNTDYILKKNPEVGTYLIYEMDDTNKEANLIGKSDTWYEATIVKPKLVLKKNMNKSSIQNNVKLNKTINFFKNKILKLNKNEKNNNSKFLNKKRKRKKKKRKYPKDSTVIEIKRIFDNQDKKEEEEKDNTNKNEEKNN